VRGEALYRTPAWLSASKLATIHPGPGQHQGRKTSLLAPGGSMSYEGLEAASS